MSPSNTAAWIEGAKEQLVVKESAYPSPKPDEVVIKVAALAINPVDWKLQRYPFMPLPYPVIFGEDVAGEIAEVGSDVKGFHKGQRVIGHAIGLNGDSRQSGFQQYMAAPTVVVSPIPSNMSFEQAVVLPLATSTAAAGLYQKENLALPAPSLSPKSTGKTLLVWSGSSSVGSCAIQLAVASGLEVITTSSPRNFQYCKDLGAAQVFDYNSKTVNDDIIAALKGKTLVGVYDAASFDESLSAAAEIVTQTSGKGLVVSVLPGTEEKSTEHVTVKSVMATSIVANEVSKMIYEDYMPQALEQGKYVPKPDPSVVGKGLESLQGAMDKAAEGVSRQKIVVSM